MSGIMGMLLGAKTAIAAAVDEFFNRVTLLLPGDGTNGAQNNTFLDSSSNNFTITRNGNTTQGTFSPFSQTGWSVQFDRADYNNLLISSSSDFDFSSGDFTIEMWINPQSLPASGDGSFHYIFATTNLVAFFFSGNIYFRNQATTELVTPVAHGMSSGVWYHLAFVRSGSSYAIYRNGSSISTGSGATVAAGASALTIAGSSGYNGITACTLSNFRITNGQALYTSTFTPATAPLTTTSQSATASNVKLLTCQSNRFIDNSTQNTKTIQFGSGTTLGNRSIQAFSPFAPTAAYSAATVGGSGYFDGSGDYLSVPSSSNLAFGTGDFCVEFWLYRTGTTGGVFSNAVNSGGGDAQFEIQLNGTNKVVLIGWNTTFMTGATTINTNTWYHIAVVRSGTSMAIFVNGTRDATATSSNNFSSTNAFVVGLQAAGSGATTGYISSLRAVKGSFVYNPSSTTVTIPTEPVTAITNTQLLLNYTNAGITDATAKNDLETVGNAQISTTQSKFGGSSIYLDGTGDYLTLPTTNQSLTFGSANWTIEFWIYLPSLPNTRKEILYLNGNTSGYAAVALHICSNNKLGLSFSESGSGWKTDDTTGVGTALSATTWQYVAVTRNGQNIQIYLDGAAQGSAYTTTASTTSLMTTYTLNQIGTYNTSSFQLNAYIDDLRITLGQVRTVTTSPTAAFPLQ